MLLRVSGSATKTTVDLEALLADERADCGVPAGRALREFALAVIRERAPEEVSRSRERLSTEIGPAGAVDAAATTAFFNAFDRVADATGTDPDPPTMELIGQWLPDLRPPGSQEPAA